MSLAFPPQTRYEQPKMNDQIVLEPIGHLRSCYPEKFGTPRQPGLVPEATAELEIVPSLQPELAFEGLEKFSHVWLIFGFHKNTNSTYRPKVHPPRLEGKTIGVFATRSPHRPNPIGLSLVRLEKISNNTLFLSGVDLIDGTPIYDIKPYITAIESIPKAQTGWVDSATDPKIEFEWPAEQAKELENWAKSSKKPELKNLIEATLKRDPRPLVYRGYEDKEQSKYREIHAVRLFEGDVHFRFTSPNHVQIVKIMPQTQVTKP